ncbi:MAG: hypothetical protein BWY72_01749 [Bacteroidetes bacterium ADurb.Bin416]|nr:MAG: hypothetical protein BWY72_01749 [Bacteroidetes bacterium ADurb.Bin416]
MLVVWFETFDGTCFCLNDIDASVIISYPNIVVPVHHQAAQQVAAQFAFAHIPAPTSKVIVRIQGQQAKGSGSLESHPARSLTVFNDGCARRHVFRENGKFERIVHSVSASVKNVHTVHAAQPKIAGRIFKNTGN